MHRSLWPLPGGADQTITTLLEILTWIDAQRRPQYDMLHQWLQQRYQLNATGFARGAIDLSRRLGVISTEPVGAIVLTHRGTELLRTRDTSILLDALMREFVGVYDVLATVERMRRARPEAVMNALRTTYPNWKTTAQYVHRLNWLYSLGCMKKSGLLYTITPAGTKVVQDYGELRLLGVSLRADHGGEAEADDDLGAEHELALAEEDASEDTDVESLPAQVHAVRTEAERLAERLAAAALESDDASGFERVLVDAFRFLGFIAEHKSGPGDTDVLVTAPLGQDSYRAVVDGKSSRHGKVGKQQIEWYALGRHKAMHNADYILVVAPGFSGGDLLDNATRADAGLLTADDLATVVISHGRTPLSLADLRDLFRYPGDPRLPLQRIQEKTSEVARLQNLVPDIIRTFESNYRYGMFEPISVDAVPFLLAHRHGRTIYTRDEIVAALELLSSPLMGALRKATDTAYVLQMPMGSVARRFDAQARLLLEALDAEMIPANRHGGIGGAD